MLPSTRIARTIARLTLDRAERQRLAELSPLDAGHGYDSFGMHPDWARAAVGVASPLYDHYFRVCSHGAEHVPTRGAAILAANHSGTLPFDGAMICIDVIRHTNPPRMPRTVADLFAPRLPFVGTVLGRVGVVSGARRNIHRLLEDDALLLVFPEGMPAIGKPFRKRYVLQGWRVGHVELALRHRAPIVPVAVIGAEEAWPQLGRIGFIHPFGSPYVPIPATPFPLPVRYHIHYGPPIALHDRFRPEDHDDPRVTEAASGLVRDAVQELIDAGLQERRRLFR